MNRRPDAFHALVLGLILLLAVIAAAWCSIVNPTPPEVLPTPTSFPVVAVTSTPTATSTPMVSPMVPTKAPSPTFSPLPKSPTATSLPMVVVLDTPTPTPSPLPTAAPPKPAPVQLPRKP